MGQSRSYRLGDVDIDHGGRAEGWRTSIPGLDHQRPLAVLLYCDVLHNLHGLDVWLQLNLTSVTVDVKCIVRVGFHYGVLDDIVWRLCVIIHGLDREQNESELLEI